MADEGLHEIQLNGKQLVFLFMAATVVSVVIFLCGVMVGRGVVVRRGDLVAIAAEQGQIDPTAPLDAPLASVAPSAGASGGALPSSQESLSYPDRLSADSAPPETLKEEPPAPAPETPGPEPSSPAAPVAQAGVAAGSDEPAGPGFVVQVAAIRERAEADRMAKRLVGNGYAAYVTVPNSGAARVFRVRIGKFQDRREAESVASRLEREEQFKPWITR